MAPAARRAGRRARGGADAARPTRRSRCRPPPPSRPPRPKSCPAPPGAAWVPAGAPGWPLSPHLTRARRARGRAAGAGPGQARWAVPQGPNAGGSGPPGRPAARTRPRPARRGLGRGSVQGQAGRRRATTRRRHSESAPGQRARARQWRAAPRSRTPRLPCHPAPAPGRRRRTDPNRTQSRPRAPRSRPPQAAQGRRAGCATRPAARRRTCPALPPPEVPARCAVPAAPKRSPNPARQIRRRRPAATAPTGPPSRQSRSWCGQRAYGERGPGPAADQPRWRQGAPG